MTCPACGKPVAMVQGRGSRGPTSGDLVVCLSCGAVCVADERMVLRILLPERARLMNQRIVLEAIAFSDLVLARRGMSTRH